MIHRLLSVSKNSSFFIFGARGTGKSTYIQKQLLTELKEFLYIDLLDDDKEELYSRNPNRLKSEILSLDKLPKWVIIDEIQKIPRLLDIVQTVIEEKKVKFILTGSSARKLKISGANLLGGRAFDYNLFPFTSFELGIHFNIEDYLNFGMLPSLLEFDQTQDKIKYLKSYIKTYIKLEIQMEQLLKKLEPFREFLEIAAQMNGKLLNFTKISKEVGVDVKTIQTYYSILEETFLGYRIPSFHHSLRKSQLLTSKFYFFDNGVVRGLQNALASKVVSGTSYYGEIFEHFIVLEIIKMNAYTEFDYKISHFTTKEGIEIDLVLSRGKELIFIEIKSTLKIDETEVKTLSRFCNDFKCKSYYLSQDDTQINIENVMCRHWRKGLQEIFEIRTP